MILVVVAVEAVAAYGLQVLEAIDELPNAAHEVAVGGVVHGIGLGHAEDASVLDLGPAGEADHFQLAGPQLDEPRIWSVPEGVTLRAEVFQPEAALAGVRDHVWAPVGEVLDASDLDVGGVYVDPVIGEEIALVDDETDGQEVPIGQAAGGIDDLGRGRRGQLEDELRDRHARDEVAARNLFLAAVLGDHHRVHPVACAEDPDDVAVEADLATLLGDLGSHGLPHHPGPESRIIELLD